MWALTCDDILFLRDAIQISRKGYARTHPVSAVVQTSRIANGIARLDGFTERQTTSVALGTGLPL